ncbi:MAG TPA: fatty acid desaturase [Gemmatimonadaceae bacterium]|nr:fatty acid desaturase [Gemmatimonadaceae bacterium]
MTSTSTAPHAEPAGEEFHDDIIHPSPVPFILVHLASLGAIWSGVTLEAVVLGLSLYVARMFGVTAGFHRYFSHRSFKTSRVAQFVLAFMAQTSAQRGVLWWAAKHRHHHKHSDTEHDVHSPRHRGFIYSHVGWIFTKEHEDTDYDAIPDLTKYPELVWLNNHPYLPAALLAIACFALAGWPGLFVGFFWSTTLLYHGTFFINSLAHVHGTQRYVTGDDSRNNWWLAIITMGEGWHNNHHAYQRSTRQGFRWYEFDPTYYILAMLSWVRIVWDLGEPPRDVVRNERRVGRAVVEKVAHHLAATFPSEQIAQRLRDAIDQSPALRELRDRVAAGQARAEELLAGLHAPHLPSIEEGKARAHEMLASVHLPHIPTLAEIRARAEEMYARSPSTDEIVARARELILHAVSRELVPAPAQG